MTPLLALLSCAGGPDTGAPASPPIDSAGDTAPVCETGTIEGQVFDGSGSLDPFPEAVVSLQLAGEAPLQTRTDTLGRWSAEIPPGEWTLWAEDDAGTCISSQRLEVQLALCAEVEVALTIDQCV